MSNTPNIQKMLHDGKSPDAPKMPTAGQVAAVEQLPLETFLAEWAAKEFSLEKCPELHKTHPLMYARSRMVDLAKALKENDYAK